MSAMTAVSDFSVSENDGILSKDLNVLFGNIEYLAKTGMEKTNRVILDIKNQKAKTK